RWPWRRAAPRAKATATTDAPVPEPRRKRRKRGRHEDPLRRLAQFDALVTAPPANGETVPTGHSVSAGAATAVPERAEPMPGLLHEDDALDEILVGEPVDLDPTVDVEVPVDADVPVDVDAPVVVDAGVGDDLTLADDVERP